MSTMPPIPPKFTMSHTSLRERVHLGNRCGETLMSLEMTRIRSEGFEFVKGIAAEIRLLARSIVPVDSASHLNLMEERTILRDPSARRE